MKQAIDDILKMSVSERLRIVETIWDSIAAHPDTLPVTDAQKRELDRRLEDYEADPKQGRSWDDVRKSLRERR